MIYVIAATKRIADMVARGKGAHGRGYHYLYDWSYLMGLRDATIYVYWGSAPHGLARSRMLDNVRTAERRGHTLIEVAESELVP